VKATSTSTIRLNGRTVLSPSTTRCRKETGSISGCVKCFTDGRTKAGLAAARRRDKKSGRPGRQNDAPTIASVQTLFADRSISRDDIGTTLNIAKSALYRTVLLLTDKEGSAGRVEQLERPHSEVCRWGV